MIQSCPISQNRVDSNMIRIISVLVAFTSVLYILTSNLIFIYIIFIDFTLRVFRLNSYSPYLQMAYMYSNIFNLKPKICDEAPKRFALILGWLLSLFMVLSSFISINITILVAFIFFILASMEMIFEYCIGCKIYQYLKKINIL